MEKMLKCSSFFGHRCGTYPICCMFSNSNAHQIIIESPPGFVIGLYTKCYYSKSHILKLRNQAYREIFKIVLLSYQLVMLITISSISLELL